MAELATSSQIFQVRPSVTIPVIAYTASLVTEIATILICNSSSAAARFSIFHDDDSGVATIATILYHEVSVAASHTEVIGGQYPGTGISIAPGGTLSVQSHTISALTFTAYGKTTSTIGNQNG